jgi:hypothetical protein
MNHAAPLITTLATGLGLALLLGFLAARLKLPALVGYLLAGVLIGPFTPGFVANAEIAGELAEIGVMLLMFGVGLHFSLNDLLEVRRIALPGAVLQIAVATALGTGVAVAWGWGLRGSLVFGLALSVASTVVLLRALEARGTLKSINGRIAVGWLVVEDLAIVVALVMLPPLAGWLGGTAPGSEDGNLWRALSMALLKVAAFITLMLVVGRRVFPALLWQVARIGSRELFTLCIVAAAVSIRTARPCCSAFRLLSARSSPAWSCANPSSATVPRRVAAATGGVRGTFLRLGRHVVRSRHSHRAAAAGACGGGHHRYRQVHCRGRIGASLWLSLEYRAHGIGEPGSNRGVLVHTGRARREPRPAPRRRAKPGSRRSPDLYCPQPVSVYGGRAVSGLDKVPLRARPNAGAVGRSFSRAAEGHG